MPDDPTVSLADLQLSSLHALLAALLSSARMRPPYFGRALEFSAKVKFFGNLRFVCFNSHDVKNNGNIHSVSSWIYYMQYSFLSTYLLYVIGFCR